MRRRFVGQRRDVQTSERDEGTLGAIVIGQPVGAPRVRDVDLDDYEIRPIVSGQRLDVLVDDLGLVVRPQVRGKRGEAERREERVPDWPPEGAGGLRQRREDELDAEDTCHAYSLYCKVFVDVKRHGGSVRCCAR